MRFPNAVYAFFRNTKYTGAVADDGSVYGAGYYTATNTGAEFQALEKAKAVSCTWFAIGI